MTVKQLALHQGFTAVSMPDPEREIKNVYIGDLLSWVMSKAQQDDAWITIMSNINVVAVASLTDTACVILAENVILDENTIKAANEKGINILSTPESAYDIAKYLSKVL
jgi:predicted transcriptional regulator